MRKFSFRLETLLHIRELAKEKAIVNYGKAIAEREKCEKKLDFELTNLTLLKKQIKEMNEDDVKGYEELVKFTKKIFDKGFIELADVAFDKPLIMMKQLTALLKLKS